ncbi:MAG: BrnA antitoxin family protein [Hyphomicrobiales bacterium]
MAKRKLTKRYTAAELERIAAKGGDRSDWRRASSMSKRAVEAAVASDPDEEGMEVDWSKAAIVLPESKAMLTLRLDRDVLDWFRRQGRGYQTRINAVLRSYVEQKERRSGG